MVLTDKSGIQNSRTMLRAFGGLNETYGCTEAEYSAGVNFSARNFPALSTRLLRRRVADMPNLNGAYHLNGMMYVRGCDITYTNDDSGMTFERKNAVADSKKTMVGIGTKIIILPDNIAYDTADNSVSSLGAKWSGEGVTVEITPCDGDGKTYTVQGWGKTEPENPADGTVFLKTENTALPWSSASVLEVYSTESGNWSTVQLDYCLVKAQGIGKSFCEGDTVTISESAAVLMEQYADFDGDRIVYAADENSLRIKAGDGGERFYGTVTQDGDYAVWQSIDGTQSRRYSADEVFAAERRIPHLDFVAECDNRLWGCSSRENVIYACKLGDPTNWFSYRGIAADSYAVTVGSDGAFTGAASCMGYALFFKENAVHKLYGTKPSDFTVSCVHCRGVAKNASQSLCVINETLYYLSPEGVMAWDGSLPEKVSGALDGAKLCGVQKAAGAHLDGRYYLYIQRSNKSRLLCYDTERGLWSEEDAFCTDMISTGRQVYFWDGTALWAADGSREGGETGLEQAVKFELATGDIGLDSIDDKYASRLTLRLDADCGSRVELSVSYDGKPWETVRTFNAEKKCRCYDVQFVPRRHNTMRLKLSGEGQITIRSAAKTMAAAKGKILGEAV